MTVPTRSEQSEFLDVVIVGAGAAGLITLRRLLETRNLEPTGKKRSLRVTVFEKNADLGGVWLYSDVPDGPPVRFPCVTPAVGEARADDPLPTSPMYKNLRTNLPTSIMAVPDFPFATDEDADDEDEDAAKTDPTARFPSHSRVLQYLRDFADAHQLVKFVRFNTEVTDVRRQCGRDSQYPTSCWEVTYRDLAHRSGGGGDGGSVGVFRADAVVICNGHNAVPFVPNIEGLAGYAAKFNREYDAAVQHSITYRAPENFTDQTVLIVGGASSAIDIARDIVPFAKSVTQSVRTRGGTADIGEPVGSTKNPQQGQSITITGVITKMDPETGTICFEDGATMPRPDRVLFATGYLYSFPFLKHLDSSYVKDDVDGGHTTAESDLLISDGMYVHNLWEQIFYMKDPTLSFIGIPTKITPFELFDYQAEFLARVLIGAISLPDESEMRRTGRINSIPSDDVLGDKHVGGVEQPLFPGRQRHVLHMAQYGYCDRLAKYAGLKPVDPRRIEERAHMQELRKRVLGY